MKIITILALLVCCFSCETLKAKNIVIPSCSVTAPPASLGLDTTFYKRYVNCNGIPIISSGNVPDSCLEQAYRTLYAMICCLPKAVQKSLVDYGTKVAVIGKWEGETDLPEHRFMAQDTSVNMDIRARGMEGTLEVPMTSCAEENILAYRIDKYHAEDILIHEFAHSIHLIGLKRIDPSIDDKITKLMNAAIAEGKYTNTYALENHIEYWAEAVQDWFNVNAESPIPDGKHNWVNTREDLKNYDPRMYQFLSQYFTESDVQYSRHPNINLYTHDDVDAWKKLKGANDRKFEVPAPTITAVPDDLKTRLGLSDFYKKYINCHGIHILSSWRVPDSCLVQVNRTVYGMVSELPGQVLSALKKADARVVVMARYEGTMDVPEFAYLKSDKSVNWNQKARGMAGTMECPITTCAEENVLGYQIDKYYKEDRLVRNLAQMILNIGIQQFKPDTKEHLATLMAKALESGTYKDTDDGISLEDYWSEGVQDWFNANRTDGRMQGITLRGEMMEKDPELAQIISDYFTHTYDKISTHSKTLEQMDAAKGLKIEEGYMPFIGYKTYYRIVGECKGNKKPVILLHGGPGSGHNYFEVLDCIAKTGRAVISYDQLGSGKSYLDGHPELWTVDTWAKELIELRKYLHIDQCHILGQSWGGMLLLAYITDMPHDGVCSAILSSTNPSAKVWSDEQHRMIKYLPENEQQAIARAEATGDFSDSAYIAANDHYMELHCAGKVTEDSPECLRRPNKHGDESYLYGWGPNEYVPSGSLYDFEYLGRMGDIKEPTLVIDGSEDLCTPYIAKRMYDGLRKGKWEMFQGCRHMPFIEDHDHYCDVLVKWLDEND